MGPSTAATTYDGGPTQIVVVGRTGYYSPWWTASDYAVNGGLWRFNFDPQALDLAGNTTRVRDASRLVLMSDAAGWHQSWRPPAVTPAGGLSLADLIGSSGDPARAKVDRGRHGGTLNAVFVDGHVETLKINPPALGSAWLLLP